MSHFRTIDPMTVSVPPRQRGQGRARARPRKRIALTALKCAAARI
jgi:hypothetical protein